MQVSWIDPDVLRNLAIQLQDPTPVKEVSAWELNSMPELALLGEVDTDPVASAVPEAPPSQLPNAIVDEKAAQIAHIRDQLRSIREKAQQAGLLTPQIKEEAPVVKEEPVVEATPRGPVEKVLPVVPNEPAQVESATFLALDGTMAERLESFAKWIARLVVSDELLLIDDHGGLLYGSPSRSDLTMSALMALNSEQRSTAQAVGRPPEVLRTKLNEDRELSLFPCPTRFGVVTLVIVNATGIPSESVAWLREALVLAIEGKASDESDETKTDAESTQLSKSPFDT